MKFKAIVFDMDGTLIEERSSWLKAHDFFKVDCSKNHRDYLEGRISYSEFMRRDIYEWIKKEKISVQQVKKALIPFTPVKGAEEFIAKAKEKNYIICLITAGIDLLANEVAKKFGIDYVYSNGFEVDSEGFLNGKAICAVRLNGKERTLQKFCAQAELKPKEIISIGDSKFDAEILKASGLGIAFNPHDDEIKKAADIIVEGNDLSKALQFI